MKCFSALIYMAISAQFLFAASDESCSFFITDIKDYAEPTDAEITEMSKSLLNVISVQFGANKLVKPRTPASVKLKIMHIDTSKNMMASFAKDIQTGKGCSFSLKPGCYRFECDGYKLKIEERISDSTSLITVADSIVSVPHGGNAVRCNRLRHITIYRYPVAAMVTLKGRVLDERGHAMANVKVNGSPICMDEYDVMCHEEIYATTDEEGTYEFRNLSPASFDLAVRYLLFGRVMKASFPSEKIFHFTVSTQVSDSSRSNGFRRIQIPLITQNNLSGLRKTAKAIREMAATTTMNQYFCTDMSRPEKTLPVSTNNVIYVGDIVLPAKESPKRKD